MTITEDDLSRSIEFKVYVRSGIVGKRLSLALAYRSCMDLFAEMGEEEKKLEEKRRREEAEAKEREIERQREDLRAKLVKKMADLKKATKAAEKEFDDFHEEERVRFEKKGLVYRKEHVKRANIKKDNSAIRNAKNRKLSKK
jgi:FKBP-type peptidyl-prolyl cis-trans isomerase